MTDRPKGFVLTPSRLGKPPNTEETTAAKPVFTGLKQSKLGLLAESKFNFGGPNQSRAEGEEKKEGELIRPTTFSFTPLTKKEEDVENSILWSKKDAVDPGKEKSKESSLPKPIFGENLLGKAVIPSSTDSAPIFGQNLAEKVALPTSPSSDSSQEKEKSKATETPDLLFSSAAAAAAAPLPQEDEKKTLSESAAEYTETHAMKRKYDEVTVVTGEEEESNVLQANVKLYLFDREKRNWTERGRGLLRLNDAPNSSPGHLKSRLVMRTTGSLRVVLNTKLWPEMICEKVNEKNIRISATDNEHVSIFLIAASHKDTEKLYTALEYRISQLKQDKEEGGEQEEEEEDEDDEGEPAVKRPVPAVD